MKSPTRQYKDLKRALSNAKKITRGVDMHECKNDLQFLKLHSYILLCHSAIEEYIEKLGEEVALEARRVFTRDGVITKALIAMVSAKIIDDLPEKGRKRVSTDLVVNIDEFSKEAFNRYKSILKSNNGITTKDQMAVLLPIGVDPENTDLVLMQAMHNFGAKRGEVAHSFKVRRNDTLADVWASVNTIANLLVGYDQAACRCIVTRMHANTL
jgi:hypothetical protein